MLPASEGAATRANLAPRLQRMVPFEGTTADLLALMPDAAADATRLAKRLGGMASELAAAGVVLERRREAGTGRRVVTLRLAAEWKAATAACGGTVTLETPPAPAWGTSCGCGQRGWWLDAGIWRCGHCEPPPAGRTARFVFT